MCLLIGVALLAINIYGLTQDLKPKDIQLEHLRFGDRDVRMSRETLLSQMNKTTEETEEEFSIRMTLAIADTIAHIKWTDYPAEMFNQRVPFWENYILSLMGRYSGIPEYERYHFSSPEKSIERGIGICGDASMILSEILTRQGIKNWIISSEEHVMVEAIIDNTARLLDPDFGVVLEYDSAYYIDKPEEFVKEFNNAGFINDTEDRLARSLQKGIEYWNGTSHFITKKYYFEKLSYFLKWTIPLLLIFYYLAVQFLNKSSRLKRVNSAIKN